MKHWVIYIAFAWLGTIILGGVDAVRAVRKGPQPQPQPLVSEPHRQNKLGA